MPSEHGFVEQLDDIINEVAQWDEISKGNDFSGVSVDVVKELTTRCLAAIGRIAAADSPYGREAESVLATNWYAGLKLSCLVGVVRALRADLEAGYLQTIEEMIHGETFADFLEMAGYLLEEGYKDAAAVIAGSTLEAHLRALCQKAGLPVERSSPKGVRPKKADSLNADLAGAGAYSKLDQKSVTAWLGLRNDAAHGNYAAYGPEQVDLLVSGVREFMARVAA